jgi:protein-tyrosine sulfotransferase
MNFKYIYNTYLNIKCLTILFLIVSLILNRLNFDKKCLDYYRDKKIPTAINFVNNTRNEPIIIVGGFEKSGCSLMRVLLDVHPLIRCTEAISELSFIIKSSTAWLNSRVESSRLKHAGMTQDIIDNAVSSYFLEILVKYRDFAQNFCIKDKLFIQSMDYVSSLFPNSKFILMIRDVRAAAFSSASSNIGDIKNSFQEWNTFNKKAYYNCTTLGPDRCLTVFYENLVTRPEAEIRKIYKFLNIEWFDLVLNHRHFIGDIVSNEIKRPINTDSLYKWVGRINSNHSFIEEFAPLMIKLGYDTRSVKPNYKF